MLLDLEMKRTDIGEMDLHNPRGLVEHMETLRIEYINSRNLQPIKLVIAGPPCSGKTALAKHLALQYSLRVIQAKDIVAAVHKLDAEDGTAVEHALKGGKAGPGRIPPALMAKLCRRLLCGVMESNRGFILDGFPRTLREARELFTDAREWSAEEAEDQASLQAALAALVAQPAPTGKAAKGKAAPKQATAPARSIDDVADPRQICKQWQPDALVRS
jgi:adenylate kinase